MTVRLYNILTLTNTADKPTNKQTKAEQEIL